MHLREQISVYLVDSNIKTLAVYLRCLYIVHISTQPYSYREKRVFKWFLTPIK